MDANQALNWIEGRGWLVLSSGPDTLGDLRGQALTKMVINQGSVAYVGLDMDEHEDLIDDMNELGAPTGYLVNVRTEDDDTIFDRLAEAVVIVIPGDYDLDALRNVLQGAAIEGIKAAYERGAVVLVEGRSVSLFGKVVLLDDDRQAVDGFGWVEDAFIAPAVTSVSVSDSAFTVLETQLVSTAIGIGEGSALVLGPFGQIETWGERRVTIALGSGSSSQSNGSSGE